MTGDSHDRAGPVFHQHIVGDPDGNHPAGRRVDRVRAGKDTGLFLVRLAGDHILLRGRGAVRGNLIALLRGRDRLNERILGGKHEVRRAEDRIGARREHRNLLRTGRHFGRHVHRGRSGVFEWIHHAEPQLGALAPADPRSLRRARRV